MEGSDGQKAEGQDSMEMDSNGKPQRSGKGKRYRDFIAENGIKPFKRDRKVCLVYIYQYISVLRPYIHKSVF